MRLETITGEQILAGLALVVLAVLGVMLVSEPMPAANATILATIVGGLVGQLTVAAGKKAVDMLTGAKPTVNITQPPAGGAPNGDT